MISIPNLDDRNFDQIVEEAIKLIPQLTNEWTDMNYHDPGITFVDLFAWLVEMQQYYLNRIPNKNVLKFLKLLGCMPKSAVASKTLINFDLGGGLCSIPQGTKISTEDDIIFETRERMNYLPVNIEKVIVGTELDFVDNTVPNTYDGVYYYAFGMKVKQGNKLYIGFDKELPVNKDIRLAIKFFDDYEVKRGNFLAEEDFLTPISKISLQYYGMREEEVGWHVTKMKKDDTVQFLLDGSIMFRIHHSMMPAKINAAYDKERYWICFNVEEEGFSIAPRIESIEINTIEAVQKDTKSIITELSSDGKGLQLFVLNHYLNFYGNNKVQIKDEDGNWIYWREAEEKEQVRADEKVYWIERNEEDKTINIIFGDNIQGQIPTYGKNNIRVVSYAKDFENGRIIGKEHAGIVNFVDMNMQGIIAEELILQVGVRKERENGGAKDGVNGEDYFYEDYLWRDWTLVEDLNNSSGDSLHYSMDYETNLITFGDNEKGLNAFNNDDNIVCIIGCALTVGEQGNVKEKRVNRLLIDDIDSNKIRIVNNYEARGGKSRETIDEAKMRVLFEIRKPYRSVTSDDYEEIVLKTPGLYISKVKAIPLYKPGMSNYPLNKALGQITVVVVPYSEGERIRPSKGFLENIKRYVDRHRLLCTEIHVIGPEYVEVSIVASVVVKSHIHVDIKKIINTLEKFFLGDDKRGWTLGKTLSRADLYEAINELDGVEYISDLFINVKGKGIRKIENGDIEIPPYVLLYSGKHEIEVISREDLL